jgi:thiol-disulfide isomerase/thioredoxin
MPDPGAGGRCTTSTAAVCTDGPATKVIDGVRSPATAGSTEHDDVQRRRAGRPVRAAGGRRLHAAVVDLRQTNAVTGVCEVVRGRLQLPGAGADRHHRQQLPVQRLLPEGNCFDIGAPNDADFARSMSMLEAGREAGVYLDTDRMQVFKGEENRCRDRLLKNCCYADGAGARHDEPEPLRQRLAPGLRRADELREPGVHLPGHVGAADGRRLQRHVHDLRRDGRGQRRRTARRGRWLYAGDSLVVAFDPWSLVIAVIIYIVLSMMSCNEDEGKLAMKEGAKLCHTIGTWCSSCIRILGVCVSCIEHTTSKCCFNSMLARIVNEQGRAQIGKGWGGAQSADCSGFTVAQLQTLNFAAMDLSEFYASLVPTLPNVATLQGNAPAACPPATTAKGSANEAHHRSRAGAGHRALGPAPPWLRNALPVRDAKQLLLRPSMRPTGRPTGVLVGQIADAITKRFKATTPIYIDVSTERAMPRPGCSRLKVRFWQDGVQLPYGVHQAPRGRPSTSASTTAATASRPVAVVRRAHDAVRIALAARCVRTLSTVSLAGTIALRSAGPGRPLLVRQLARLALLRGAGTRARTDRLRHREGRTGLERPRPTPAGQAARDRRVRAPAEAPRGDPEHRHHAADRSQRPPLHGARGQVVRAPPPSPTWRSASPGPRPELDMTLQGRPVNAKALEVFDQLQQAQRSQSLGALGRDHVLFFFFRSDCPYCHAFAPTLEAFQARHGIQVVAISVDGGPMPGFPDAGATTASRPRCR